MASSAIVEPKRRRRLTNAEYRALDQALIQIIEEMYPITVRGVYYQAEVRNLVEKTEKGYDRVQGRVLKLRRDGDVPFDWIADESRWVRRMLRYDSMETFQHSIASRYHKDYWADSLVRVEVWVEKDALSGVIYDTVVDHWGVDLYVQKGFSSATYLYQAAQKILGSGKSTHIYVLSDFDPSGKVSLGKVESGLREHLGDEADIHIHDLAVTPEQIRAWSLPTRPTKVANNSHWPSFLKQYGGDAYESCELDAISPPVLRQLVGDAIRRHWTHELTIEQMKAMERAERAELQKVTFRPS
jgi:hypothetical protein